MQNEENERESRNEEPEKIRKREVQIRKDEVIKALNRTKSGKAVAPDDIPVEIWKCLGELAIDFLTRLFSRILETRYPMSGGKVFWCQFTRRVMCTEG